MQTILPSPKAVRAALSQVPSTLNVQGRGPTHPVNMTPPNHTPHRQHAATRLFHTPASVRLVVASRSQHAKHAQVLHVASSAHRGRRDRPTCNSHDDSNGTPAPRRLRIRETNSLSKRSDLSIDFSRQSRSFWRRKAGNRLDDTRHR